MPTRAALGVNRQEVIYFDSRPMSISPNSHILSSPDHSGDEDKDELRCISPLSPETAKKVQDSAECGKLDHQDQSTTQSVASCQDFCITIKGKVEPEQTAAKAPLQILSFLRAGKRAASTIL